MPDALSAPFTMNITALAASPGGDPFASEIDRAFWELGYVNGSFDTEAEAQAAIDELIAARPEFRFLSFEMEVI